MCLQSSLLRRSLRPDKLMKGYTVFISEGVLEDMVPTLANLRTIVANAGGR